MFQSCFVKHSLKYFSAQELLKPIFVDFKLNAMKNSLFQFSISDLHSVKPGLKEIYLKRGLFRQANFICNHLSIERYRKTWYLFIMAIRLSKVHQAITMSSTRMLISGIFKQLSTFVSVPDGLSKFSRQGMFSSSDVV